MYSEPSFAPNVEPIFIFDSLDEWNISYNQINELNKIFLELSKKWKVIITSRPWYFYNEETNTIKWVARKNWIKWFHSR